MNSSTFRNGDVPAYNRFACGAWNVPETQREMNVDSVDLQVLKSAREWQKAGHRVVLVTITNTWGSAPRPVGALTAIRDDGLVAGSVSGGCVEDDMISRVRARELAGETPSTTRYGVTEE